MKYLASPYSSPYELTREHRFKAVCKVAAKLIKEGEMIFCPIAHSHSILTIGKIGFSFVEWKEFCERTIEFCDELVVLKLVGWENSIGVQAEIELAKKMKKPITYLEPKDYL